MKDFLMNDENLPSPIAGGFGSIITILFGFITANEVNKVIGILGSILGLGIAFFAIVNSYRNNIKTQIETEREQIELKIKQLELEKLEKESKE